jgi:low-density lipoprotein receptor class B
MTGTAVRGLRVALVCCVVLLGAMTTQAGAYVYWASGTATGRAALDGSGVQPVFIPTASYGVAVDGQYVYWAIGSTIGRADIDGTSANSTFVSGASNVTGVAVDGQHIYWTNFSANSIGRANLDGSAVNQSFITGANGPTGLAIDHDHLYWGNYSTGYVARANIDGSATNETFIAGANGPSGVAVDSGHVYWTNYGGGTIGRASLDGSAPIQSFITGATSPLGIAVDGGHLYWANSISGGSIGRTNLDGSAPAQSFISAASPRELAVDSGPAGVATPSAVALSFPGSRPLGVFSAPQAVTITNTGHGALQLSGVTVTGADPDDFLISADGCTGSQLPIGGSCTVDVRFGPVAAGPRAAALAVSSNAGASVQVALNGTGGALPVGAAGATGSTGATGAPGPAGPRGSAGKIELVTCSTVTRTVTRKGKRRKVKVKECKTRQVSGTVKFTTASARLTRGAVVYATGTARGNRVVLQRRRRTLPTGRYTLELTHRSGRLTTTTRQPVQIR